MITPLGVHLALCLCFRTEWLTCSDSKGNRNDVINVNQSKFFKEIARIMMNSVVGKALNDKRDFKVSLSSSATEYVAVLYPQQKQMQQMFQKIVLISTANGQWLLRLSL